MEFKGSKTEANLMAAFAGESQARNKYTYYGAKARQDGYEQIGDIFDMTAANEKEHAEIWFKLLHDNAMPGTAVNLPDAVAGEHYEHSEMYPEFAKAAREEGFEKIARLFELVAAIEKEHEDRFNALYKNLQDGQVFSRPTSQTWVCRNCGFIMEGAKPPAQCPVCSKPQSYFELQAENY